MNPDILQHFEVGRLLDSYVDALDNDRLEAWPGFFIDACHYEIIPKENEDLGLPAPLMLCSNRRMLEDRVLSLRHANIYAPVIYRHFISGLVCRSEGDIIVAQSNYLVINTSQLGQSVVYQTGRYEDRIVSTEAGLRFASKRVIYDTARVQTLLAIPI